MGGLQKILEKYHLEKWFQKENLVVLVLVGILLIVIALPTKKSDTEEDKDSYDLLQNDLWTGVGLENSSYGANSESYGSNSGLYNGSSNGSGLYNGSANSSVQNGNNQNTSGQNNSTGAENGLSAMDYTASLEKKLAEILSRIQGIGQVYVMITLKQSEELVVEKDLLDDQQQTIYETQGNASTPYVVKTIFPKVEGVVVVAEGAGTGKVTQNIVEMVQALFDIEIHKIKVAAGDV